MPTCMHCFTTLLPMLTSRRIHHVKFPPAGAGEGGHVQADAHRCAVWRGAGEALCRRRRLVSCLLDDLLTPGCNFHLHAHNKPAPALLSPCLPQSKRRPHLALEGGEQQQQQGAAAIGDLEDFGANPVAAAAAAAGPVGIATTLDPEAAAAEAAAAAGREGENAAAAANQGDEEMPDRCDSAVSSVAGMRGCWCQHGCLQLIDWTELPAWLVAVARTSKHIPCALPVCPARCSVPQAHRLPRLAGGQEGAVAAQPGGAQAQAGGWKFGLEHLAQALCRVQVPPASMHFLSHGPSRTPV